MHAAGAFRVCAHCGSLSRCSKGLRGDGSAACSCNVNRQKPTSSRRPIEHWPVVHVPAGLDLPAETLHQTANVELETLLYHPVIIVSPGVAGHPALQCMRLTLGGKVIAQRHGDDAASAGEQSLGVRAALYPRLVEPGQALHQAVAQMLQGHSFVVIEGVSGGFPTKSKPSSRA